MKRRKIGFVGAVAAALFGVAGLAASANWAISTISAKFALAGDVFEAAKTVEQPTEWTLSVDGAGTLKDGVFELKGGDNAASWRSNPVAFEPGKVYRFRFKASVVPGGGSGASAPSGTSFAHYDFSDFPKKETPEDYYSFVFVAPKGVKEAQLRLGQWDSHRDYRFAEPTLTAVQPAYRILVAGDPKEALPLGAGESIADGVYRFTSFRASEPTNFDRPLVSTTSHFNTNRWTLGNDAEVVYRFALEPKTCKVEMHADGIGGSERAGKIVKTRNIPFVSGKISMNIGHSTAGRAVLEGSLDGKNWAALGEIAGTGSVEATLEKLLDGKAADEIFVRVRGEAGEDGKWCNSQVYNLSAELTLNPNDAPLFSGLGETYFADYIDGADYLVGEDKRDNFKKRSGQGNASAQTWELWGLNEGNFWRLSGDRYRETSINWLTQDEKSPLFGENGGSPDCERRYVLGGGRPVVFGTRFFPYFVQNFTREISGLTGKTGKVSLSWCEQDYRIPKNAKETKIGAAEPIRIYAAKNDFESFQVAVRAFGDGIDFLSGAVVGDLTGPNGATISAENVDLRYAYYHYVANPTDKTCAVGWYPDALVPLEVGSDGLGAPLGVEVGENLPIWTTVRVPADAAPGTYRGAIRLSGTTETRERSRISADEYDATIPFEVVVWDFALPAKNTLETAYGMSPGNIWRYHNCKTEEDKRAVFEKYLKIFGDYRISPYNPAPLDGIGVKWFPEENPPRCELDFSRFEKEMTRVFAQYNFTNFKLPFEGLGWGTYAESAEGEIAGYAGDTPQYKAMIADYGKKLQEGLRERGLLDAAYVYWFDEPEPKDYGFVARGFGKLKKYAPEIDRMLTEEPSPEFRKILEENDASIDVWCPVSPAYDEAQGKIEKDAGNRFWWYVCTYPKEPYCTEFTDHPPVELRIWHWQTFERGITGCLVWESTYWTSSAAFPNEAQNPYLDPMCYVSGYSTPAGTKQFWGNGDGRFIYPPLSAATPGRNDGKPIFDDPVASVRWEMIREGVQDYEMLAMLKKLTENRDLTDAQRKKVEEIFDFSPITTDMTTFSTDPKPLLEKRRAVAEAIVELSK